MRRGERLLGEQVSKDLLERAVTVNGKGAVKIGEVIVQPGVEARVLDRVLGPTLDWMVDDYGLVPVVGTLGLGTEAGRNAMAQTTVNNIRRVHRAMIRGKS